MDRKQSLENKIKAVCFFAVWCLAAVFFYFSVIRCIFGGTIWDRGIYAVASVSFGIVAGLSVCALPFEKIISAINDSDVKIDIIQISSFALICLMTLYYYDSASEYGHNVATRVMNSAFGIVLLSMYRKEEWKEKGVSLLWMAVTVIAAYGAVFGGYSPRDRVLKTMSVITVLIYIPLLYCFGKRVVKRESNQKISVCGWLVFLFFAGMIILRNTRWWPFSVVVPFTVLYGYSFTERFINRFLKNYCYGCILAFWLMFGSGILFRPYYSFEFIRYPSWFASVASAGLFWMLVFGCTVSAILAKVEKGKKLCVKKIFFELVTLGAVSTYMLMTLSRTAALSVTVFLFTAFVLSEAFYYRDSLKGMFYKVLLIVCPVFLLFPVIYTVTRCGPALVARPVWVTKAEWFSDRIEKGEAPDSTKYMNIAQLGETFLEKWCGLNINLSQMAGAVSGPDNAIMTDEDGNIVLGNNVVGTYEAEDGQLTALKDYSFYNENTDDVSNGRFDIFQAYYKNLNVTGHDTMIVEDEELDIALYHAHNTYMQVAYDHGIAVGILFIVMVLFGLFCSVVYYIKNCDKVNFAVYPVIVILSFMISGVTEWIFHPSIPIGFAFLIGLTPLVQKKERYEKD